MRTILSALLVATLAGCSYEDGRIWRRSVCDPIVDDADRARCLEDANRSGKEYRRDVEEAREP